MAEGLCGQGRQCARRPLCRRRRARSTPATAIATSDVDRRKELQGLINDPNLKLTFAADRVQVAESGDLAYSRGHYAITTTDPKTSKPVDSQGSYLTVYKKQADGSWKATEDFITPGPATSDGSEVAKRSLVRT